jgi:hypothetical protein
MKVASFEFSDETLDGRDHIRINNYTNNKFLSYEVSFGT